MMHIDEPESFKSQYRQAKDKRDWIIKNAQCVCCTPHELGTWLREQGEDVDMRRLAGNPGFSRPRGKTAQAETEPEATPDDTITLTETEVSILRQYAGKYNEAHDGTDECGIMAAADRLATALDVILTIAAARASV